MVEEDVTKMRNKGRWNIMRQNSIEGLFEAGYNSKSCGCRFLFGFVSLVQKNISTSIY